MHPMELVVYGLVALVILLVIFTIPFARNAGKAFKKQNKALDEQGDIVERQKEMLATNKEILKTLKEIKVALENKQITQ